MSIKKRIGPIIAGLCAGAVNGLFGAGGGMILVPLLSWFADMDDREIFPASVCIILPICIISLSITYTRSSLMPDLTALYLAGSAGGGILAGIFGKKIPTLWLHRLLGILILWGGIRYLC